MSDSSLTTWLSALPLLITIVAAVVGALAWRYGRRAIRTIVAVLLIVVGAATLFFPVGLLTSLAAGTVIVLLGVAMLIAEYRPGTVA